MTISASSQLAARAGDQLVLAVASLDSGTATSRIIEVLGEGGRPPYVVLLAYGRIATYRGDSQVDEPSLSRAAQARASCVSEG